jgi:hypothetical protein
MGLAACRGGPPSPSISWNHRVRGRLRTKSWRSITYGQNLDVKGLIHRTRGINSQNGTDALSGRRHGLDDDCKSAGLCARSDVTCGCGKSKELQGRLCPGVELPHSSQKSGLNGPPVVTRNSGARPHLGDIGNHTIVRCAVACRLLVCAWGWGMEDTVALKVTRKNLQRLAEAFANDAADPYQNLHRADVMAHFKMNIEDAWSEGIEVYATEDGFVFSEWGVMSQYRVAAQA